MLARAARTIARFLAKSQPPFVGEADSSRVMHSRIETHQFHAGALPSPQWPVIIP
jgi:hypothetical protein